MTVTCNIENCSYYDNGFCGKILLNLYGGKCEEPYNRRTGAPQYLNSTQSLEDKVPIVIEDYESP